ncbi:hypothetical protein C1T23_01934 [Lactiplantibacillus plantarum]|nr:hypothetical protein C1T23_01934 [Lactiplantibacillus plantarum]MBA2818522.1 hypothetical protein [Lactiplantibacillus plantarum]MCG0660628.1 hypothetical protein [Lactiplantibacillus plantarum]
MQMQLSVVLLERLSSRIINSYTYRLLHSLSYSLSISVSKIIFRIQFICELGSFF